MEKGNNINKFERNQVTFLLVIDKESKGRKAKVA
jgi:hypothetical protein